MLPVLEAIREQDPHPDVTLAREVWVTLSPPDRELCDTWQTAVSSRGFDVYEAPEGKLSARNAAHAHAVSEGHNVIVSWDADARPLSDTTLRELLSPVVREGYACSNSRPVSAPDGVSGMIVDAAAAIEDVAIPHVHGQLHAFTADAWTEAGPFDETVSQTDIGEVRAEEEFAFRRRLSAVGGVKDVPGATVYNDPRRHYCRIPGVGDDAYCNRRGETTFAPTHPR